VAIHRRTFSLPPLSGAIPDSLRGAYAPHREEFDVSDPAGISTHWPRELSGVLFWLSATPLGSSVEDPELSLTSAFVTSVEIVRGRVRRQRGAFVVTKALSSTLDVPALADRVDLASWGATDQILLGAQRLLVGGVDGLPYVMKSNLETLGVATLDAVLDRPSSEAWLSADRGDSVYLVAHDEDGGSEVLRYSAESAQLSAQRLDSRLQRPFHLALSQERLVVFGATHLQVFDRDLNLGSDHIVPAGDLAMEAVLGAQETQGGIRVFFARRRRHGLKLASVTIAEHGLDTNKINPTAFSSLAQRVAGKRHDGWRSIGIEHRDVGQATILTSVDLLDGTQERRVFPNDVFAGRPIYVQGLRSNHHLAIVPTNQADGSNQALLLLDTEHVDGPELATVHLPRHLPLDGQGVFVVKQQLR